MRHTKWIAAQAYNQQITHDIDRRALFAQWLELDKAIDHDGDAEVSAAERQQWDIERRLDSLGWRVAFDLVTQKTVLVAAR
jgi:hypothetical protein